jgi:hypothetical protein
MQFLKGPKLVDGIRENGREYAKSIGKTLEQLEKEMMKDFDLYTTVLVRSNSRLTAPH